MCVWVGGVKVGCALTGDSQDEIAFFARVPDARSIDGLHREVVACPLIEAIHDIIRRGRSSALHQWREAPNAIQLHVDPVGGDSLSIVLLRLGPIQVNEVPADDLSCRLPRHRPRS